MRRLSQTHTHFPFPLTHTHFPFPLTTNPDPDLNPKANPSPNPNQVSSPLCRALQTLEGAFPTLGSRQFGKEVKVC